MKILVYGAGVLGSYLAHTLIQADNDVSILARGNRYEQLVQDGLVIEHYIQKKTTIDEIKVIQTLETDHYYDLIFVVMKYNQFQSVLPILAENVSENIVLVGNNADTKSMQEFLIQNSRTRKNVSFGFQMSGGMRTDSGHVISIHGKGNVMFGELRDTQSVYPIVKKAFGDRYKVKYQIDIDAWLKTHYVFILAMNATYYIFDNDMKKVSKDKYALKRMIKATDEGFAILEKLGYKITPSIMRKLVRQYRFIYLYGMKIYHKLPMNEVVSGTFDEIYALYETFQKLKKAAHLTTESWDRLERKAVGKYKLKTSSK